MRIDKSRNKKDGYKRTGAPRAALRATSKGRAC
uniref:Uncharacterized protein n=1 Tax=Arundo donax TaxID=35708 RepID=A0A0A9TT42_ARUDO